MSMLAPVVFVCGAFYEASCVGFVHFSEGGSPWKTATMSMLAGAAEVTGIFGSVHDWHVGPFFVLGLGVGAFAGVTLKQRRVPEGTPGEGKGPMNRDTMYCNDCRHVSACERASQCLSGSVHGPGRPRTRPGNTAEERVAAMSMLKMHVIDHRYVKGCKSNGGLACYCCRTVEWLEAHSDYKHVSPPDDGSIRIELRAAT